MSRTRPAMQEKKIQLYGVNATGFRRGGRSSRSVKGKSFFLDIAALVITTVAVMKICYNSHRLITRSSRLVSGQQKSKETQTNPHNNQPKPTKSDQSVVRRVKHVCALTTWCIAQKPRLSQHLQQLIECHTSNT